MVVLTSFVFSVAPVVEPTKITGEYFNDTFYFYCNISDPDSTYVMYEYVIYRNNVSIFENSTYRYEHHENISGRGAATSWYATCNDENGSYPCWMWDNSWNTKNFGSGPLFEDYARFHYQKPENFTYRPLIWETKDGAGRRNTTITSYDHSGAIYFEIRVRDNYYYVDWRVKNSGSYITSYRQNTSNTVYEEALYIPVFEFVNTGERLAYSSSNFQFPDELKIGCRGYDGDNYSAWVNSSITYLVNTLPIFNQSGFSYNTIHHLGVSLQVNATDPDDNSITYSINDSRFTINLSSGWINRTTSQSDVGVYNVTVGANDGYGTTNMSFLINITNTAPSVSNVIISPSPADNLDNLTCLNNSAPYDENGDTVTYQYRWYKESIDQNITVQGLGSGNTSIGDNWTCSITPLDGLENGTKVSSQIVQIGQAEVSPTILSTNATTNGQNISNSTQPTEYADNLTLAVSFSDPNNNTFQAFFCKTSGANAFGCTGQTWCNTSHSSSTEVSCNANISGTSLDTTYNYFVYVVDNTSKISSPYMNSFYIGDETIPSIYGDSLSASSGVNNAPVTIYVTVYDENTISSVFVEVTDPNSARDNYSMSGSGNGEYSKVFTPSTDGSYSINFFVSDQSGNENSLASSLTYTDSTQAIQGGGGGGGTTINMYGSNKRVCNIEAKPSDIRFAFAKTIKKIAILNKDNESFSPTFKKINVIGELSDNFEIQNAISTILPDREDSFGVTFTPDYVFEPGEVVISLTSDNCKDINITLSVSEELRSTSIFEDFFAGRMSLSDLIFENVFSESNSYRKVLPWLTVGIVAAIMFAIIATLLLGQIIKSFNERTYIRTVLWVFFIFISSAVATIFTVAGIRTL